VGAASLLSLGLREARGAFCGGRAAAAAGEYRGDGDDEHGGLTSALPAGMVAVQQCAAHLSA
jgi:hypothetical protein